VAPLLLAAFLSCSADCDGPGAGPAHAAFPDPLDTAVANTVVARVGPTSITAREFFFNYLFGPSFVKKRPDSRRRHLDFMLHEKLLALGEEAKGKIQDPALKRTSWPWREMLRQKNSIATMCWAGSV